LLRWISNHPDEAKAKGLAASKYVHQNWTWEHAARLATKRLQQLKN
jgi:hypothetical protein